MARKRSGSAPPWPGYPDRAARAAAQNSALQPEDLPFTSVEATHIREHLHALLADRHDRSAKLEPSLAVLFAGAQRAATRFEAALELATAPVAPQPDWRPKLRRLKRHPSGLTRLLEDPQYAALLEHGVYLANDALRNEDDWRAWLSSSPEDLARAVDRLLTDALLQADGGPERNDALLTYLEDLAAIYEAASGRLLARSVSYSATAPEKSGLPRGPALHFLRACVQPFLPTITDETIANRIRQVRTRRVA